MPLSRSSWKKVNISQDTAKVMQFQICVYHIWDISGRLWLVFTIFILEKHIAKANVSMHVEPSRERYSKL
jgi:hypothetical protein